MDKKRIKKITVIVLFIITSLILLNSVYTYFNPKKETQVFTNYSKVIDDIKKEKIDSVTVTEKSNGTRNLLVTDKEKNTYKILGPRDNILPQLLTENNIKFEINEEPAPSFLERFLISWGPTLFFVAVWVYFMRSMMKSSSGGRGLFSFNKSKAQLIDPDKLETTFDDVVGCDEAKKEVQEFVDFFSNPEKFQQLGGRIPKGLLLTGPAGTGKAQPLYSNIRVPDGWKKMGEMKIDDLVCDPDGGYSKVIGIFPQGIKNNFKVTFSDGSTAESCDEHLWTVRFSDFHKEYKEYTLSQIKEKLDKGYSPRVYPIKKVDSPELDLPLDPYFLGVLLGDGCVATSHSVVSIASADPEIIENVKNIIGENYSIVKKDKYDHLIQMNTKVDKYLCRLGVYQNGLTQSLWDMGLCGKHSHEKFIPKDYFYSSYEQRLSLLQGLMDTDGTIEGSTNFTYYSTTSKELANDVVEIARSLGMISYINSEKLKTYTYRGAKHIANHTSYNVTIKSYEPSILFRLTRKKNLAKTRQHMPTKSIVKIESIGQTEMQCIMLDSVNHLYITDGYNTTHNTLLAKALAKESKVPFYAISGSEFVEMFVGVGASRVRDMFEIAKKAAPCVLFIDEIDAIGGKRSQGSFGNGGSDEREQTLNQILVEMDGMDTQSNIILVGATNRPEILDPALLRPGRFDRQVMVSLPDVIGRETIVKTHLNLKKVPISIGVDLHKIARGTPGFSGAELANLVNESAIFAARRNSKFVEQIDLENAKDKIMMGPERPSLAMSDEDKRDTAYHEAGHTIVAKLLKDSDPVYKVTIIPRGRALGLTQQLPDKDRFSYKKEYLADRLAILMGGRAAEDIFCNTLTTGASNDIAVATSTARSMVMEWGMSSLGPIGFGSREQSFLGGGSLRANNLSENTMQKVDFEVEKLLNNAADIAHRLLSENKHKVEAMTNALMEVETLDDWQIENIMANRHYNDNAGMLEFKAVTDKKIQDEKDRRALLEGKKPEVRFIDSNPNSDLQPS